jgi:hypothetical protein
LDVVSTNEVLDFKLDIYPNPAVDKLNVESEKKIKSIDLLDNTGKIMVK